MQSSTASRANGGTSPDIARASRAAESLVREGGNVMLAGWPPADAGAIAADLRGRFEAEGWAVLAADVGNAAGPEDIFAAIAGAAAPILPRRSDGMLRRIGNRVREIGLRGFGLTLYCKFRAPPEGGIGRQYGSDPIRDCAALDRPVLLLVNGLPDAFDTIRRQRRGAERAETALLRLRDALRNAEGGSPAIVVFDGAEDSPLARDLGISCRVARPAPLPAAPEPVR